VVLRLKFPDSAAPVSAVGLFQAGKQLLPDSKGFYSIAFDQKELTEKSLASN